MKILEQIITNESFTIKTFSTKNGNVTYKVSDGSISATNNDNEQLKVSIADVLDVLNMVGYPLNGIILDRGSLQIH